MFVGASGTTGRLRELSCRRSLGILHPGGRGSSDGTAGDDDDADSRPLSPDKTLRQARYSLDLSKQQTRTRPQQLGPGALAPKQQQQQQQQPPQHQEPQQHDRGHDQQPQLLRASHPQMLGSTRPAAAKPAAKATLVKNGRPPDRLGAKPAVALSAPAVPSLAAVQGKGFRQGHPLAPASAAAAAAPNTLLEEDAAADGGEHTCSVLQDGAGRPMPAQQHALHGQASTNGSSSGSGSSSRCSSICPDDQLLLAAAIDSLHGRQQPGPHRQDMPSSGIRGGTQASWAAGWAPAAAGSLSATAAEPAAAGGAWPAPHGAAGTSAAAHAHGLLSAHIGRTAPNGSQQDAGQSAASGVHPRDPQAGSLAAQAVGGSSSSSSSHSGGSSGGSRRLEAEDSGVLALLAAVDSSHDAGLGRRQQRLSATHMLACHDKQQHHHHQHQKQQEPLRPCTAPGARAGVHQHVGAAAAVAAAMSRGAATVLKGHRRQQQQQQQQTASMDLQGLCGPRPLPPAQSSQHQQHEVVQDHMQHDLQHREQLELGQQQVLEAPTRPGQRQTAQLELGQQWQQGRPPPPRQVPVCVQGNQHQPARIGLGAEALPPLREHAGAAPCSHSERAAHAGCTLPAEDEQGRDCLGGAAAGAAPDMQQQAGCQGGGAHSLSPSEFEELSREVAARIIQMHWRLRRQRCQQQRQQQQQQPEPHVQLQLPAEAVHEAVQVPASQQQQPAEDDCSSRSSSSSQELSHNGRQPAALDRLRAHAGSRNALRLQQHGKAAGTAATHQASATAAGAAAAAAAAAVAEPAEELLPLAPQTYEQQQQQQQGREGAAGGAGGAGKAVEHDDQHTGSANPVTAGSSAEASTLCAGPPEAPPSAAAPASAALPPTDLVQQQQQQQLQQPAADKLGSILAFLDAVEAGAEQVAGGNTRTLLPASQLIGRPGSSCLPARTAAGAPCAVQGFRSASAQHWQSLQQPCVHHQMPGQASQHARVPAQPSQPVLLWDGGGMVGPDAPSGWSHSAVAEPGSALRPEVSVAGSVTSAAGSCATCPGSARPAVLAESVFDGVRARMHHLKAALAAKEEAVQALAQELEAVQTDHQQQLQSVAAVQQQHLAAAAAEASAAQSRHLGLIDRLMEEKDRLRAERDLAQEAVKAMAERQAAAVAALKQGWAAELKRQAANWEAAAAARQEAWRVAKVAEIKEQTVKGLEVEVQRLINRHKAELGAAQEAAAEQTRAAVGAARTEHEAQLKGLRERMKQECEEAVERERSAAAARMREACERWEGQAQAARMRLLADTDIKLEASAAAVREEKRRSEAALEAAEARLAAREAQLRQEWDGQKEALARVHGRALESAKQAAADERTAWRSAVTEQLRRQAGEREERLRAQLLKQRDEQLEVVIRRLEAEGAAARASAADKVAAEHTVAIKALQEQLQQAQLATKRLAERCKAAAAAAATSERQRAELEQQLVEARQQLSGQHQTLSNARASLAAKEAEAAAAVATAAAAAASGRQELAADKARLEGRLQELQEQLRQQRQQHEVEMQHVELRVKGAISRKDEAICQLQQQLAAALQSLRGTEAVLAAQQEELCC